MSVGDRAQPPRGEIQLGEWLVTPEWVQSYLEAVGDSPGNYLQLGLVPPLALTACVLGRVLETLELPGGTIHSLQEMETLAPLEIGSSVTGGRAAGAAPPPWRPGVHHCVLHPVRARRAAGPAGQDHRVDPGSRSQPRRAPPTERFNDDRTWPGTAPGGQDHYPAPVG